MICQAYLDSNVLVPAENIHAKPPKNLTATALEEETRVLSQGMYTDLEMAALIAREHGVLESLESGHHEKRPHWLRTYQENRKNLLEVIRGRNKDLIMLACREHIEKVSETLDLLGDKE
jgi:hypothetical protein